MRRQLARSTVAMLLAVLAAGAAEPELETDEAKTLYALGVRLGTEIMHLQLTEAELGSVVAGLKDGALNRPRRVDAATFGERITELTRTRRAAAAEANRKAGRAFLDGVAATEGTVRTASGLCLRTLKEGSGASPRAGDQVSVHYTGALVDGTVFDSTVERGMPMTFSLSRVLPCWSEGLTLMREGAKAKLYCPAEIAYGDMGRPRIPPGSTLVFDVELLAVVAQDEPAVQPKPQP
jgi:FKBP-type peptidyl-prolyl cis-trans isomerase